MIAGEPDTSCPSVDTLFAKVGGYLPEDELPALEHHLAECDACGLVLAEAGRALVSDGVDEVPDPPPQARSLPKVGDKVGRYLLMEVLGRGAMGIVFAAYDPDLDRKVAVKLVRMGGRDRDPELEARLLGEAQAMARLSHPNVVAVHDIGSVDGGVYLAMELVVGQTLRAWLSHSPPRPWRAIVERFLHAGDGLAAAHAAGIVHRDFKPDNVLVHESGRVLVTDFGLAKTQIGAHHSDRLSTSDLVTTRAGTILGTPAYMAPEQLDSGPVDVRADVFAFGASLYEALYRARPYAGSTLAELEQSLRRGIPNEPPPSKVPGWVRRVVMRALAGDPAARYPSMAALLEALRADPARRLRTIGLPILALIVVAGTIAVVRYLTTAEARGCRESASVVERVWDADTVARAEAAFVATGKPYAREAFAAASKIFGEHLEHWRDARIAACDATHSEGLQSPALLDLRLGCLDQRLDEAKALATTFLAADATTVDKAAEAAARLPDSAICAESERLTARVPPPVDPIARGLVHDAGERLARASAAALVGSWAEAARLGEEATTLSQQAAYAPSEAEALTLRADVAFSAGDNVEARRLYELALSASIAAGDDRIAAQAAMDYGRIIGFVTRDKTDALRWTKLAEAEIKRLGGAPALSAELLLRRADIAILALEGETAVADLEAAAKLQVDAPELVLVGTLETLAQTYQQAERYPEAIATFERALALLRNNLGPEHPRTLGLATNFGGCLVSSGHYAAAERLLAATEIHQARIYPPDHPDTATLLHMRGLSLTGLGRFDEAIALHDKGIAIERRVYGDNLGQVALTSTFLALAQIRAGRGAKALEALVTARALADKHLAGNAAIAGTITLLHAMALEADGQLAEARTAFETFEPVARTTFPGGTELAWTLGGLARARLHQQRAEDAAKLLEEALAMLESSYGPTSLELAPTLVDLGAALFAAGRPRPEGPLERVLAMAAQEQADPLLVAEARFTLAEILRQRDPARSAQLEGEALAVTRASPYPRAARLTERWTPR